MKSRLLALSALLLFSLGFFLVARSAASWRPQIIGEAPGAYAMEASPDGRWLKTISVGIGTPDDEQERVHLIDTTGQTATRVFSADFTKFCADGQRLVSFDDSSQQLQLTETATGRTIQSWKGLTPGEFERISDAQLRKGGRELVVVTPFRISRLNVESGAISSSVVIQIEWHPPEGCGMMSGQTLFRDGRRLLYLNGTEAWIYDAQTGKRLASCEMGDLSPDEKTLYNWSPEGGEAWFMDVKSGQTLWQSAMENAPQWAGDGRSIIDVDARTGVHLLDPRTGKSIEKLKVPVPRMDVNGTNETYALSPDGNFWFVRQKNKILRFRLR